jgi:NADPH:quinone reductase
MTTTMRAVRVHAFGGPEVLRVDELPIPQPGPGEVLIRVHVAGINFVESTVRAGLYPAAAAVGLVPPFVPGSEVAGVIAAVGPGESRWRPGDRVAALVGFGGGYAQYVVCGGQVPMRLPDALGDAQVLPLISQGATAFLALTETGVSVVGRHLLVHGASSGVGSMLVQLGRVFGARRIVATTRGVSKRAHLQALGAHDVVDTTQGDWPRQVLEATGGAGVHAVFDLVGAGVGPASLACMAPRATYVVLGHLGGSIAQFDPMHAYGLMGGNHRVAYLGLPPNCMTHEPERLREPMQTLLQFAADGRIRGELGPSFRLEAAADAHRAIERADRVGKLYFEGLAT